MDAYLEAEYNNRLKVPGFAAITRGWSEDAAAYRATWPHTELALAYGPTPRQTLDLFWPGPARRAPLCMFIHGGYWQALDRAQFSHLAHGLNANGIAVAIPSYDLCPSVTLAELTQQLRDCAAFLARRHGCGVFATGHSAGGHLAAMLLASGHATAAMPISGLFDLAPLLRTTVMAGVPIDAAEARRLSPMFLPPPGRPLHAIVGGDEGVEYAAQSQGIAQAWNGSWESLPGHNHFTIIAPLADPASPMVRRALELIS